MTLTIGYLSPYLIGQNQRVSQNEFYISFTRLAWVELDLNWPRVICVLCTQANIHQKSSQVSQCAFRNYIAEWFGEWVMGLQQRSTFDILLKVFVSLLPLPNHPPDFSNVRSTFRTMPVCPCCNKCHVSNQFSQTDCINVAVVNWNV